MSSLSSSSSAAAGPRAAGDITTFCVAAMVYKLARASWEVLGGGEWVELHLIFRAQESLGSRAFKVVAWIPATRQVVMNLRLSREARMTLARESFGELVVDDKTFGMHFASVEQARDALRAFESAIAELSNRRKASLASIPDIESSLAQQLEAPNVTSLTHETHVVYNSREARFEGLPESWKSSGLMAQFGVPIQTLPKVEVEGYSAKIPAVVVALARKLGELQGFGVVGIFRVAPDHQVCKETKEAIDRGDKWDNDNLDAHAVANLIKIFFRELPPVGLLNWLGDSAIDKLAKAPPPDAPDHLTHCNDPHKSLLLWLLDLMVTVVRHETSNRMSAKNVAIVFSPNLYSTHNDNPMAALTMAQACCDALHTLLLWRLNHVQH